MTNAVAAHGLCVLVAAAFPCSDEYTIADLITFLTVRLCMRGELQAGVVSA
jgi:hypothetical protein